MPSRPRARSKNVSRKRGRGACKPATDAVPETPEETQVSADMLGDELWMKVLGFVPVRDLLPLRAISQKFSELVSDVLPGAIINAKFQCGTTITIDGPDGCIAMQQHLWQCRRLATDDEAGDIDGNAYLFTTEGKFHELFDLIIGCTYSIQLEKRDLNGEEICLVYDKRYSITMPSLILWHFLPTEDVLPDEEQFEDWQWSPNYKRDTLWTNQGQRYVVPEEPDMWMALEDYDEMDNPKRTHGSFRAPLHGDKGGQTAVLLGWDLPVMVDASVSSPAVGMCKGKTGHLAAFNMSKIVVSEDFMLSKLCKKFPDGWENVFDVGDLPANVEIG